MFEKKKEGNILSLVLGTRIEQRPLYLACESGRACYEKDMSLALGGHTRIALTYNVATLYIYRGYSS